MINSPIQRQIEHLYNKYKGLSDGDVADYIPELALADANWFGIVIATIDGHIYQIGDIDKEFTIQSISKPFTYALALEDRGIEYVATKVGVEPSGDAFNAISLDKNGVPANPMINAGAIATTSLVLGTDDAVIERIRKKYSAFAARELTIDKKVYESESETGHRNRAIGYMLRNFNIIESDPTPTLESYFQQCSVSINCKDLAIMGATLANHGINPLTNKCVLDSKYVKYVLSVMTSAGMYNYAGNWIYKVGLPAKSGVGGGILTILPGQLAIAVFSPPLDELGNSVRGLRVLEEMSETLNLHFFNSNRFSKSFIKSILDLTKINSNKTRNEEERQLLKERGNEAVIYKIQGDISFASMEYLSRTILELKSTKYIIIDVSVANEIAQSALMIMYDFYTLLKQDGIQMLFCGENKYLYEYFIALDRNHESIFFKGKDLVIEWCEDALIMKYLNKASKSQIYKLSDFYICRHLEEDEFAQLNDISKIKTADKGEKIISKGDDSNSLYLLSCGRVGVYLEKESKQIRVASIEAGNSIGEIAMIDNSPRSADVVAEERVEYYEIHFDDKKYETIKNKLIKNISVELVQKLRRTNSLIETLI